ncbi:MAG: DNA-binding response regulator [Planctomycetota bacterium]|nr:MAG: DNA-binding response regulator [Planctomycetota bacterium]
MTAESHDSGSRTPTRCVRLLKVLVVDKDTVYGPTIRLALEEAGYYLNLVTDVHEGCRRVQERAYDLVIVSASVGTAALEGILDILSQRVSPPGVIVLADPDELRMDGESHGVPCLSILRHHCAITDVVDTARALVGVPWSDHREGA